MYYDEEIEKYVSEFDGVYFDSEDEPPADCEDRIKILAKNYWKNFDRIVEFILPYLQELREVFGDVDAEMVKAKLGQATIHLDVNRVVYYEETFDDDGFVLSFSDDEFKDLYDFDFLG